MIMRPLKISLKRGVALFTFCTIFLPMIIGGVAFVTYHQQTTLKSISSENLRLANAIGGTVSSFLEAPHHTLTAVSQFSASKVRSPAELDELLAQLVTSYGFFESIMILDQRGIVTNIGVGRGVALTRHDHIGTDLSGTDTVRQARHSSEHVWSNTFISTITGEPTLSLALPFSSGIIIGNINLKDLSRIVAPEAKGQEHAYLVNRTGRIIACTDRRHVEQQESVSTLPSVAAGLAGNSGVFSYINNGKKVFGAVTLIPETGWLVVVERAQDEVFAHLITMERSLLGALAISLLLITLLLLFISRRIVAPVVSFSNASRELAAGNYPHLPPYAGNFTELAELATNFNDMSSALQLREQKLHEQNTLLEHEVEERQLIEEQLRTQNEELAVTQEELRHQLDETVAAQLELRRSEESFRTVADWTYDWEYWIAPDSRVVYMSPSCERVTGYRPDEFMADIRLLATIVHPDDQSLFHQHLSDNLPSDQSRANELATVTFRIIHRDDSVRWVDHLCRPVFSSNGEYLGRRVSNRDTTEHRLLEQQVIQQQKLESVGLLASGIAHDFNNLLAPVFIYGEMVRNKIDQNDPSYSKLSTILEAAGKAKDLVKQLLSFSSKQQLASQLYDMNRVTGEFAEMLRRTIRGNIDLRLQLCSDSCPVVADKTQLEQIMLNLAVNAQDAISGNGRIIIETGHIILDNEYCAIHLGATPGRYVMLSFTDSGCGMDDSTLSHVFEPFFTTKATGHGTGLGLSTVYGIVKQHGGHIAIQSKVGVGTVFQVFLPESRGDGCVSPEAALPEAQQQSVTGTILLVEDNDMVREMTADLLESHNFSLLVAEHPETALALFDNHREQITLLLTDIVMPHLSGPELYEQLLVHSPELKVLFMSGYANNITVHKGALEEGVNFIAKPFTSETLLKKLHDLMGNSGGMRA